MAEQKGEGGPTAIHATGLSVLIDPCQARLDIVFVHGFKGNPERTWVQKISRRDPEQGDERPSKYQKLNVLSRKTKPSQESAVFWPRDLLPSIIPDARILTYGYDTKIRHRTGPPVSTHTVYDIAGDFLIALEAERRRDANRPVLFIVHSLGGVVVKEMLRRASVCPPGQVHLGAILNATCGIMFPGTPHDGADPRGPLLKVAERVYRAIGFTPNQQVVDSLLPTSERLREPRDAFGTLAEKHSWMIHSFQEQYAVKVIGCKVVEDNSSCLNMPNIEIAEHIGSDHIGMSRFSSLNDPEFKKVAAALRRMAHPAPIKTGPRTDSPTQEEIERLLDSLRFEQLDARHESIKRAHTRTCRWLLHNPHYLDWLNLTLLRVHHGFFWIKGKPGTGKSTIMKFILGQARNSTKDRDVLHFFFNAQGEELERSTQGMYQSLLLQLLTRRPSLQPGIASFASSMGDNDRFRWNIESLKSAFEYAVQASDSRPVICFIDALDECDTSEIRDMISFFEQLGELAISMNKKFTVCLSSRHYPHITIQHGLELVLDGHEGHTQDIADYVNSELKIGRSKLAEKIRGELQVKAAGVFMWVVLVVELLNKEHDRGRIPTLRKRLHELPDDLHTLFRDIILRDCEGKDELLLCIQWILFAKKPLKPVELYYALLSGIGPEELSTYDCHTVGIEDIGRFILDCSKGLAETTKAKAATVQFIHESVRDFLLKDNGLVEIWPHLRSGLTGDSHVKLRDCCMAYIRFKDTTPHSLPEIFEDTPSNYLTKEQHKTQRHAVLDAFPFVEYAVRNILYHADKAAESKICQEEFIKSFPLHIWIDQHNVLEKHQIRRHDPRTRLLYILAVNDWSNLIPLQLSVEACVRKAWTLRRVFACRVLQKALIRVLPLSETSKELLEKSMTGGITNLPIENSVQDDMSPPSVPKALAGADEGLGALYVCAIHCCYKRNSERRPDRHVKYNFALTQDLKWSATHGSLILRLLLDLRDKGYIDPPVNTCDGWVLSLASRTGNKSAVEFLVARNQRLSIWEYENAFLVAAKLGESAVAEVLLESGKIILFSEGVVRDKFLSAFDIALNRGYTEVSYLFRAFAPRNALSDDLTKLDDILLVRACVTAVLTGDGIFFDACINTGRLDINADYFGRGTLLSRAIRLGDANIAERITQVKDFKLEVGYHSGMRLPSYAAWHDTMSSLHHAAKCRHEATGKLLLETGQANVGARDLYGMTALNYAERPAPLGHEGIANILRDVNGSDTTSNDVCC